MADLLQIKIIKFEDFVESFFAAAHRAGEKGEGLRKQAREKVEL